MSRGSRRRRRSTAPSTSSTSARASPSRSVDVANVAWAFAAVGETDRGGLFEALKDRALAVLDDLSSQELANLVWSFSNLDDAAPCRELWLVLLDRGWTPAIFDDVAKSQLQQAYLRLTLDGAVAAVPPLDGEWARALQAALTTSDCALGSRTQLEVSAALDHLGWAHSYEYFEARSGAGRERELPRPADAARRRAAAPPRRRAPRSRPPAGRTPSPSPCAAR